MPLDNHRRCSDERRRNFYPLLPLPFPLVALPLFFATPRKDYRHGNGVKFVGWRRVKSCWSSRGCKISRKEEGRRKEKVDISWIIIMIFVIDNGDGFFFWKVCTVDKFSSRRKLGNLKIKFWKVPLIREWLKDRRFLYPSATCSKKFR